MRAGYCMPPLCVSFSCPSCLARDSYWLESTTCFRLLRSTWNRVSRTFALPRSNIKRVQPLAGAILGRRSVDKCARVEPGQVSHARVVIGDALGGCETSTCGKPEYAKYPSHPSSGSLLR